MSEQPANPPANTNATPNDSVKETIISVIISFAMAFVFRSYVVEPFRIPTGSMAPTLLGAHMQMSSPESGFDWAVNPRDSRTVGNNRVPMSVQGSRAAGMDPIVLQDPMTGRALRQSDVPLHAGDRILVLKYLYLLREPERYEVVVFKNPEDPNVNLIKRLVGLPGEDVLICDGDIFTRPAGTDGAWAIARKPDRVQDEVWATLYSSDYAPEPGTLANWRSPWRAGNVDTAGREFRLDTADASSITWDTAQRPLTDGTPYNEALPSASAARALQFPVSDLRTRARVKPDAAGLTARFLLSARQHEFAAVVTNTEASVRMRPRGGEWTTLASTPGAYLPENVFTTIEFSHADQALQLRLNGKTVVEGVYGWSPSDRYANAAIAGRERVEPADPSTFRGAEVSIDLEGSPATLAGVALDRDLYYRAQRQNGRYHRATHPSYPATLGPDHFFMLGDNSAASHDGRSWSRVDPWIGDALGYNAGVVHRRLILGKAFMVYWPAPYYASVPPGLKLPVPDVGRVRFIR